MTRLSDKYIRKNVLRVENCPNDDYSNYIVSLISLHIHTMSDDDKKKIINLLTEILNIQELNFDKIQVFFDEE